MNKCFAVPAMFLALFFLDACRFSSQKWETEVLQACDSTELTNLKIKVVLPRTGHSSEPAREKVRAILVSVMDHSLASVASYEGKRLFPTYDGDTEDTQALLEYYRRETSSAFGREAVSACEEMKTYMEEDSGWTFPAWEYDFSIQKAGESQRYIVFDATEYSYRGGAHGGVGGEGSLTFDKKDGTLVRDWLLPDCLGPMQPLLRKGLAEYFSEGGDSVSPDDLTSYLLLEPGEQTLPLPAWSPFPSDKGLVFTYQQYEIAAYAAGMPNFTIPYDAIRPFLTPKALELLRL